jgi:hypothetical protein
MRLADVAQSKVNLVAGHKSQRTNDRYTHFDTKAFTEVRNVQETLFRTEEKTRNGEGVKPGEEKEIVAQQEQETQQRAG